MLFVLGNRVLLLPGGTEIHLGTLAEQLQRLGHEVVVYSPELGVFAEQLGRRGLNVEGALLGAQLAAIRVGPAGRLRSAYRWVKRRLRSLANAAAD